MQNVSLSLNFKEKSISEIYLETTELDLDYWHQHFTPKEESKSELRNAIFSMKHSAHSIRSSVTKIIQDQKVTQIAISHKIAPMGKYSGEIRGEYKWGGDDDGFSWHAKGSAIDDYGNRADLEIRLNEDWSGNISTSIIYEEDPETETNNERGK